MGYEYKKSKSGYMWECSNKNPYLHLKGKRKNAKVAFIKNVAEHTQGLLTGKASLLLLVLLWLKVPAGSRPNTVWLRLLRIVPLANTV